MRPSGRIHVGRLARRIARTGSDRFQAGKTISRWGRRAEDGGRPEDEAVEDGSPGVNAADVELAAPLPSGGATIASSSATVVAAVNAVSSIVVWNVSSSAIISS